MVATRDQAGTLRRIAPLGRADPPSSPPDAGWAWLAEIEWDGGRHDGVFRVVARPDGREADQGERRAVAESPALQWPPRGRDAVQAVADAVAELEASLRAAGWTPLPSGDAWYARRFTWDPATSYDAVLPEWSAAPREADGHVSPPADGITWPGGTEALWRCEITWDSGYLSSRFRALALDPRAGRRRSIGASREFTWMLMEQPEPSGREYLDELGRLMTELIAMGWEPIGQGPEWYAARFVWRDPVPPDGLDVITPEAVRLANETLARALRHPDAR
jgi:hypothetical protein